MASILKTAIDVSQAEPEITFDPYPRRIGLQWRVIATYRGGRKEQIIGFATQAEAIEWLASEGCQAWGMARLIARS